MSLAATANTWRPRKTEVLAFSISHNLYYVKFYIMIILDCAHYKLKLMQKAIVVPLD